MITVGGHTYLRKVGFLWGPIEGFDADVADDVNVIRFYRRKDLNAILKDELRLKKLFSAAKKSRKSIPYAEKVPGKTWVLECDDFRVKLKSEVKVEGHPSQYRQPPIRGQGAGIPSQTAF